MTARPQDVALLPCPFCGGQPRLSEQSEYQGFSAREAQSMGMGISAGGFTQTTYAIECSCGTRVQSMNDDLMVARWNRRANLSAALASAQAREDELRAEVDMLRGKVDEAVVELLCRKARAERLEEALRAAWLDLEQGIDQRIVIAAIRAALSTNAATQTGETT